MGTKIAFLLICGFALITSGQNAVPSQTGLDHEPIAVASIHVDKHSSKSGEDIRLTILLELTAAAFTSRSIGD
jgi:hypothetical protein